MTVAMPLTVLSDNQVKSVLEGLTIDDLDTFRHVLASALHQFSTGAEATDDDVYQQPHRITTRHASSRVTTLYMPCCGPGGMGCKIVSLTKSNDAERAGVQPVSPTGVVNIFAADGQLTGLINAASMTAFRTALASSCLVARRNHVRVITAFGSGAQAYWHVRLALMMRGSTIRHVNIINHHFSDSAGRILKKFAVVPLYIKEREGWAHTKFSILTPTFHDYERLHREHVRNADVIFCCTPSRRPLFDGHLLTSHDGRRKGRLIIAVGSFSPEMRELPDELLIQATKHHDRQQRHFHKHADEGGVVIVDTLDGALKEAGEIISAGIGPNQLVELGELVMLHRLAIVESEEESLRSSSANTSLSDLSKLDIHTDQGSMSSVFGDASSTKSGTPRSGSVSRSGSPSRRKSSIPNPFRRGSQSPSVESEEKQENSLARWLRDGTVVYKSVGLGLMDLVVGTHLIELARQKEVGTQVMF